MCLASLERVIPLTWHTYSMIQEHVRVMAFLTVRKLAVISPKAYLDPAIRVCVEVLRMHSRALVLCLCSLVCLSLEGERCLVII